MIRLIRPLLGSTSGGLKAEFYCIVIYFQPSHVQIIYLMPSGRLTVLEHLDPFVDIRVLLDIKRKVEFQPSRVKH